MTQALATTEGAQVVPASAATIMEIIDRASKDPNTDVDKLERLLGVYERISARDAEVAFNDALNAAQALIKPVVARKRNDQTKSKYATYADLDKMVRPIYVAQGFSLSFNTGDGAEPGHVRILCRVAHSHGHSALYQVDMPADGKGAKGADVMTKTHAAGSAMTYGQRYLLKLIFNIAIATDDDGNRSSGQQQQAVTTKTTASPEGADFWGCDGPGMSAHQAKKEGFDQIHEAMREGILQQHTGPAMRTWIENNMDNIRRMPRSWRIILRAAVEEQSAGF